MFNMHKGSGANPRWMKAAKAHSRALDTFILNGMWPDNDVKGHTWYFKR